MTGRLGLVEPRFARDTEPGRRLPWTAWRRPERDRCSSEEGGVHLHPRSQWCWQVDADANDCRPTATCLVLLSSHDLDLSLQLADQVWLVQSGSLRTGTPDMLIEHGAIAEAFDTDDVSFSAVEHRFRLRSEL